MTGSGTHAQTAGSGTVWRYDHPDVSGHPSRSDFALVEADPHDVLGSPTVYIKARSVVDGKKQRTHTTITTVAALLSRYKPARVTDWPGESVWQPRHGGGAHLVVGGVVVVEIEPMGSGWWVGAGVGDLVGGTLGEAKVRALELLSGADP